MIGSTFLGYQIVGTALDAMQQAVEVAGTNIANAATPGYTQEEAVLASGTPLPTPSVAGPVSAGQIGFGVTVANIQRVRQDYLDAHYRQQNSAQGYWQTVSQNLSTTQAFFQEPSPNGLQATLGTFYGDLAALAQNPQSASARSVVVQDAQNLVDQLHTLAQNLSQATANVQQSLSSDVNQVNGLLTQIAQLNVQIQAAQTEGTTANTLLDQRGTLLDQLSGYLPIQVSTDAAGNLVVTEAAQGLTLVDGGQAGSLSAGPTGFAVTAVGATAPQPVTEQGGSLGAEEALLAGPLAPVGSSGYAGSWLGQLDQVASLLAQGINALQQSGYYLDPTTGAPTAATNVPFFQATGGGAFTAQNIAVNPLLLQSGDYVAAAQTAAAADGQNAQAMANLGSTASGTAVAAYDALVAAVGTQTAGAQSQLSTAQALTQQAQSLRQSVSGVSINQEVTAMVEAEQVYTASAKAMGTMQQMLQSLLAVVA